MEESGRASGGQSHVECQTFVHVDTQGLAGCRLNCDVPLDSEAVRAFHAAIRKRHSETLHCLQEWIKQPSIAAENRGLNEGCDLTMRLLRHAGFDEVIRIPTEGSPGIFATLDVGARRTIGVYFMYDVKQVDPTEWSSPPWEAALVDRPGLGKVLVGRGAVNQKGPEMAFLAALHAFQDAGRKFPVNLVLVAEGEEEIGSPHFLQIVESPQVQAALKRCCGLFMPSAEQELDGQVTVTLGAKGVIEVELISSGERWGRGPKKDIHSSNKGCVDSPVWHLVQALATLVSADGNTPVIEGFSDKARPLSAGDKRMIAEAAQRLNEEGMKKELGVDRWLHDLKWQEALEHLLSQPTVNIEGLMGGYTGSGGKTILPHRASAKLDLRLVPDMKASEALAALKAHLARRSFDDIEVEWIGGYDPSSSSRDSALIQAQVDVYRSHELEPVFLPRAAGSWPAYVFTSEPLRLSTGHFGLGYGSCAHAPDEFYVIESANPKIQSLDGVTYSFVEYLCALSV
jgi:acetylornithine deacetylase/succinyl-diaminopimelate desuccinylase-like protein